MTHRSPLPPPRAPLPENHSSDHPAADRRLERLARLRANGDADARRAPGASSRRRHPARGARAVALVASIAATGGVAGAIAAAERDDPEASSDPEVDADPVAPASTDTVPAAAREAGSATTDPATTDAATTDAATTDVATTDPVATDPAATSASASPVTGSEQAGDTANHADGVWLGTAEYTEWGDVQVEVTISDDRIVEVTTVQIPDDRKSQRINDGATPVLEAQAIELQAADLDIVSGATYTSRTYATSLQAALDQAALAAQTTVAQS